MAIIKRLTLSKDVICVDCQRVILKGKVAIQYKQFQEDTSIIYHVTCYKGTPQ